MSRWWGWQHVQHTHTQSHKHRAQFIEQLQHNLYKSKILQYYVKIKLLFLYLKWSCSLDYVRLLARFLCCTVSCTHERSPCQEFRLCWQRKSEVKPHTSSSRVRYLIRTCRSPTRGSMPSGVGAMGLKEEEAAESCWPRVDWQLPHPEPTSHGVDWYSSKDITGCGTADTVS